MRAKLIGAVLAAFVIPLAMLVTIEAGELPSKGKIAAPVTQAAAQDINWTGLNASAAVGYGFSRTEYDAFGAGAGQINTENLLGTVGLGYDVQLSNVIVGIMADVTVSDFEDLRGQWFIGARAGVLITPKTLVYALAGYTEEIDGNLTFKFDATTTKIQDMAGLTLGGGGEHAFGNGWAARLEYRYVSYGSEHAPEGAIDGVVDGSAIDTGEHQVRLGVVRRF